MTVSIDSFTASGGSLPYPVPMNNVVATIKGQLANDNRILLVRWQVTVGLNNVLMFSTLPLVLTMIHEVPIL